MLRSVSPHLFVECFQIDTKKIDRERLAKLEIALHRQSTLHHFWIVALCVRLVHTALLLLAYATKEGYEKRGAEVQMVNLG